MGSQCHECRSFDVVRVGASMICDQCGATAPRAGQETAAPEPEPEPVARPPIRNTRASAEARRQEALRWLAEHPWSSVLEAAAATGHSSESVRRAFHSVPHERRLRAGTLRQLEYVLPATPTVAPRFKLPLPGRHDLGTVRMPRIEVRCGS